MPPWHNESLHSFHKSSFWPSGYSGELVAYKAITGLLLVLVLGVLLLRFGKPTYAVICKRRESTEKHCVTVVMLALFKFLERMCVTRCVLLCYSISETGDTMDWSYAKSKWWVAQAYTVIHVRIHGHTHICRHTQNSTLTLDKETSTDHMCVMPTVYYHREQQAGLQPNNNTSKRHSYPGGCFYLFSFTFTQICYSLLIHFYSALLTSSLRKAHSGFKQRAFI